MWEIFSISNNNGEKQLVVTPNKQPSLSVEGVLKRTGVGYYDNINGIGANEIIIDSPRHGLKVGDYTEAELHNLFVAVKARIQDLTRDIRFRYICVFKNIGFLAGEVIKHPHTQLLALPVVPKNISEMLSNAQQHFLEKERCIFCDMIKQERDEKTRVVYENNDFIAITPYASLDPFEVEIFPKEHKHKFEDCTDTYMKQLADILREVLSRYSALLGDVAVNIALRNAPLYEYREDLTQTYSNIRHCFHWHLALRPVISHSTNISWATGIAVNPITPEQAALFLKEVDN